MSGPGRPRTTYAQFAKRVAERSGYYIYEINEIMEAIAMEAYISLRDEGRASIRGLGTIWTTKVKPKTMLIPDKSGVLQPHHISERMRVNFKASDRVKEFIEPKYKHKNHYRSVKKNARS